ncbi:hypothetical protein HDU93_006455, partial [Gonapodya sp. JEL0774]
MRSAKTSATHVLAQSVCGHLTPAVPSRADNVARVASRFDFSSVRHLAPKPDEGVEDIISKATGINRPTHLSTQREYIRVLHSKKVLETIKEKIKHGAESVRKEKWEESIDQAPFIV